MKYIGAALVLMVATASPALSQARAGQAIDYETARLSRVLTAVRITEPITLDGRLDEPAWKLATPATDFVQRQPRPGDPSRERTEVRILYDADNLYVGFYCYDSDPDNMVVNGLEEDFRHPQSDSVMGCGSRRNHKNCSRKSHRSWW